MNVNIRPLLHISLVIAAALGCGDADTTNPSARLGGALASDEGCPGTTPAPGTTTPGSSTPAAPTPSPSSPSSSLGPLLDSLVGPIAGTAQPSSIASIAAYDALLLSGAETFAPGGVRGFPQSPVLIDANYYDLAYTLYLVYFRTGDARWLTAARDVATQYRDWGGNDPAVLERKMRFEYGFAGEELIPPPRSSSTLGLAVLAAETGDQKARAIVTYQSRLYFGWTHGGSGWDMRETSYALMAILASVAQGDGDTPFEFLAGAGGSPGGTFTLREAAKFALDDILSKQGAYGAPGSFLTYQGTEGATPPNTPWANNFMGGLLMEALVMYDRVIGDPRIAPSLEAYVNWLWSTQWYSAEKAFAYSNETITFPNGNAARYPEPGLNGMYIDGWGYVARKTGNPAYVSQMNEIIAGLVAAYPNVGDPYNFFLGKMYPENFRNSLKGLGQLGSP